MKVWQIASLGLMLPLMGQAGGQAPLTQAEKNLLLSRKKWYVTFDFSISGQGGQGGSSWKVSAQSGGTIELNHVIPGQFPLSSTPADVQDTTPGRFITWMAMPTDETYRRMEAGETNPARLEGQYYPYQRQVDNVQRTEVPDGVREDTWRGAGTGYAIGPCMLSLDLKKGTYDLVFTVGGTDLGSTVRHVWRSPTDNGEEDSPPTHHYAWLQHEWMPQFAARKMIQDKKPDGSFSFRFQGGVRLATGPSGNENVNFIAIFNISPTPPSDAKLILQPEAAYDRWRPRPGRKEDEVGNWLHVDWRIEETGRVSKVDRVTFRLAKVSRYTGTCMNWPPPAAPGGGPPRAQSPSGPPLDLAFSKAIPNPNDYSLSEENQVLRVSGAAAEGGSGRVTIDCFDSAAIGELVAEAVLEDGRVLQGEFRAGRSSPKKVLIPLREEGVSDLAEVWRTRAPGMKDDEDAETIPAGDSSPGPGDGLSVWEEYRGFFQGGEWKDNCYPTRKDLFIVNKAGSGASAGIGLFEDATGLVVHAKLLDTEVMPHVVVNFNIRADRHIVDQNGLYMKPVTGTFGYACAMAGRAFPGPPKNTLAVRVIMGQEPDITVNLTPSLQVTRNVRSRHIAHELGHAIGIYHHGDRDPWTGSQFGVPWRWRTVLPGGAEEVLEGSSGGAAITVLHEATLVPLRIEEIFFQRVPQKLAKVGKWSGQHSGDADCIMRYNVAYYYELISKPNTRIAKQDSEPPGGTFCTSPAGTIFNFPTHSPQSRYGGADTKRGNCKHQFVISDKYDKQYR